MIGFTFAVSGDISGPTQTQEALCLSIEPAFPSALRCVLALETVRRHGYVEVHADPILRDLVIRAGAGIPPVHARVARAVPQHQPE